MKKRKLPKRRARLKVETVTGIAWYRPEQWERLREIAADGDNLEETYEEWVRNAENSIREMRKSDVRPEKIDVDIEELLLWCKAHNYSVDSAARAQYAADKLRQLHEGTS
jgi:hypothetical protein